MECPLCVTAAAATPTENLLPLPRRDPCCPLPCNPVPSLSPPEALVEGVLSLVNLAALVTPPSMLPEALRSHCAAPGAGVSPGGAARVVLTCLPSPNVPDELKELELRGVSRLT